MESKDRGIKCLLKVTWLLHIRHRTLAQVHVVHIQCNTVSPKMTQTIAIPLRATPLKKSLPFRGKRIVNKCLLFLLSLMCMYKVQRLTIVLEEDEGPFLWEIDPFKAKLNEIVSAYLPSPVGSI